MSVQPPVSPCFFLNSRYCRISRHAISAPSPALFLLPRGFYPFPPINLFEPSTNGHSPHRTHVFCMASRSRSSVSPLPARSILSHFYDMSQAVAFFRCSSCKPLSFPCNCSGSLFPSLTSLRDPFGVFFFRTPQVRFPPPHALFCYLCSWDISSFLNRVLPASIRSKATCFSQFLPLMTPQNPTFLHGIPRPLILFRVLILLSPSSPNRVIPSAIYKQGG